VLHFVASYLLKFPISEIWTLLNSIQLMTLVVSYNVYLPGNALSFYELLIEIADFDLIPTDKIYEASFFRLFDNLEL